jgi:peptidoglycan hydrolase CwlO-like protein
MIFSRLAGVEMGGDITNKGISRILSVEMLASLIVTVFVVGVTWASLANTVSATDVKVIKLESKQEATANSVQQVRVDLAVVKNQQNNIQQDLAEQSEKLKEQSRDIKQILQILQARPE